MSDLGMNEFKEAITKLAGTDLYGEIEELREWKQIYAKESFDAKQECSRLQAEVSKLEGILANTQDRLNQRLVECSEAATVTENLKSAYALLVKAIDKKCVIRPAKNYKRDVDAAYVEAKKIMEAK